MSNPIYPPSRLPMGYVTSEGETPGPPAVFLKYQVARRVYSFWRTHWPGYHPRLERMPPLLDGTDAGWQVTGLSAYDYSMGEAAPVRP